MKSRKEKRAERQDRLAVKLAAKKRSGVVPDLKASAEPLSIYAGNSAQAQEAYERAEAWAQSPAGTPYGARRKVAKR
jgi:hypothetical protein